MKPFQWFLIGQLVVTSVNMLRPNRITSVEGIPRVLIPKTGLGLGTDATARKVTMGTHTSKMVAKVFNLLAYIHYSFSGKIIEHFYL
jgi:hypothetical protein